MNFQVSRTFTPDPTGRPLRPYSDQVVTADLWSTVNTN